MPKVSVIVPCYNVAPYVAKCLDSLVGQTLQDIEIICVDDKSTDDTAKIVAEYAERDKRIKLIKQRKNQGVSVARNTAIDAAHGEFIGFVDPDDYIDLDFYEKLYNTAINTSADIAKAIIISVDVNGKQRTGTINSRIAINKNYFNYEFSSAIYKRTLINKHNIRFIPGVALGEDVNFQQKAAYLANKVSLIDNTAYWYIRRDDSACVPHIGHNKVISVCNASNDLHQWINSRKNVAKSDYIAVMRSVCALLTNNAGRADSDADKKFIAECIIKTLDGAKYKSEILHKYFKKHLHKPINNQNVTELFYALSLREIKYKLFGFIKIATVLYAPKLGGKILLFGKIPVCKIVHTGSTDKIYICGISVLKITQ